MPLRALPTLLLALALCTVGCDSDEANPPPLGPACSGAALFARPEDPAAPGPWPVGARTVTLAGFKVEIWYPAKRTSEVGRMRATYDLREHLPAKYRSAVPEAEAPLQPCDCYRDLPLDGRRGPYPVVVFVHGTVGFRTQTLSQMTHWASRGFVVLSAEHPQISLADYLGENFAFGTQSDDVTALLDALPRFEGEASFLQGHLDLDRVGLSGHSAGGAAVARVEGRPGIRVRIPMAAGGTTPDPFLDSTLVLGGLEDGVVPFSRQVQGYEGSPSRRRLLGLASAGHLAFSDICQIGASSGGLLAIAQRAGIPVDAFVADLAQDGCRSTQLPPERSAVLLRRATTLVLEEALTCDGERTAQTAALSSAPDVGRYEEAL